MENPRSCIAIRFTKSVNASDSERRRLGLDVDATDIINQLKVTGEQQVMLKVRVAELIRNSDRGAGADLSLIHISEPTRPY